ncbi:hypothetical protein I3760_09G201300 [Carya illinoinensis]|uniref:glutathione transferase n=1 Tax=Carya illinoinensis TaxID=32201 RepID=A0A922E642_CARIL|nr:glutathione S-transferase U8-like [Carya illinoinensis]KAG2690697.1 hypothetical protein I3760_09G201300 [Carya illinoinensis]KAG6697501.1 hypothetical protein I3842_09G203700 [Carya illinoinensis]
MVEEVVVFGVWVSPYSRRVETALRLKGVPYKYIEEDLGNKSPLLLKYNPIHEKVPVLVHNGNPIAESLVILEYIDETCPQGFPILPKDPYERATARFGSKFIDDKCMPAITQACWGEGEASDKAVEEATELLMFMENELKENRFFGGERIGMVDIAANIVGFWLGTFEQVTGVELMTRDKFPNLTNWSIEFVRNNVIKENLPPREEMISYLRKKRSAR